MLHVHLLVLGGVAPPKPELRDRLLSAVQKITARADGHFEQLDRISPPNTYRIGQPNSVKQTLYWIRNRLEEFVEESPIALPNRELKGYKHSPDRPEYGLGMSGVGRNLRLPSRKVKSDFVSTGWERLQT